jgi:Enolase, C-terminal TIM barrel domain
MVSHRSGETEDNFIADLSVGLASGQACDLYTFVYCSVLLCLYVE